MNVTLIQPPSSLLLEDKVMPPLGILYLAAWLRKQGHQVSILDLAGVDDWRKRLSDEVHKLYSASWVGLTCTTPQYDVAKRICSVVKTLAGPVPVIVGGIHTTSLVHANEMDFLANDGFDSYVVGEGYNSVDKICHDLQEFGHPAKIYTEPILKDVNLLPFAARDLIDIKSYKYKLGDTPATTFYSQYGCPYSCKYCESPMAGSFTVRAMSPQRIQDEVRYIRDTWGIKGIMFFDDEMNLSKERMLGICDKLKELGDIVWRGFMVTAKFDAELAKACKGSGCFEVASGIESGSPTILKNIRKPATLDINKRFIRTAKQAGLRVKAFCIVGLPGESWSTIAETDKFFSGLAADGYRPDDVDFSILQVYKGAPIYQDPMDVEFNMDYEKAYYKSSPESYEELVQVRTKEMDRKDLVAARNYLEAKWKPSHWLEDHTGRKDLDRVYATIEYAKKRVNKV